MSALFTKFWYKAPKSPLCTEDLWPRYLYEICAQALYNKVLFARSLQQISLQCLGLQKKEAPCQGCLGKICAKELYKKSLGKTLE